MTDLRSDLEAGGSGLVPHPDLLNAFALFRRASSPGDTADEVWKPAPPIRERFGLLPDHARRVSTPAGHEAWGIPGTRGAMLRQRTPNNRGSHTWGGWGGAVESVAITGLFGWVVSPEGVHTYYGLIPDGNPTVLLTLIDGQSIEVPVTENIFSARPNSRVRIIEFRAADGAHHAAATGIADEG